MVKQFLLIIGLLFSIEVMSQTGIGITTPDPSAKLHVSATDKGFLPPRVALTAINSATPITSPANGLMVFNTATAGVNPYQVVPGYYYWDGTGQQWVSLSTTVGNVQNQAIFRSTSSTTGTSVVTSWNSRFNNIANGDLTFSSNTTFALSNGIYKIQWGLPHQSTQTYNMMQLQENISGSWGAWLNDANFANVANGGNTDWGGTSFMTDVIDCSSSTRTLRFLNPDGRTLLTGASFIITKLNPAITTSTTADNFGNHTATKNLLLNGNYLSNDGGNEGIRVDNSGNVGIGNNAPTTTLDVTGSLQVSGSTTLKSNISVGTGAGAEGGEMQLAYAQTGNTLTGSAVSVDVYQDRLRIFEGGGTSRGVFLDLSKAPTGVGGELLWKVNSTIQSSFNINATITAPTLGTRSINQISYRLNGDKYRLTYRLGATGGTSNGSGDYLFNLPTGLTFNTASGYNPVYTGGTWSPNIAAMAPYFIPAAGGLIMGGVWTMQMHIVPYNSTQFRVVLAASTGGYGFWSNGYFAIAQDMMWDAEFEIWAQ